MKISPPRYQQKASYQAREEPQACVQWWMKWAKNGAGGHDFIQAVYLKSPMQRLEQGDVVTVTQFPRRFHQICYNEQNLAQRLLERRDINTSRYEAMQPCRGFFKHLTSGGFSVKFSKHTCTGASQARRRIF